MPHLGDIERICDIRDRQDRHLFIWANCLDCSKERWVPFIKNKPKHLRCVACATKLNNQSYGKGENHPAWKGGRIKDAKGYVRVYIKPDNFFYSMAHKNGYVLEHRLVVAKALGRCLHRWEIIHHKGVKYPKGSTENKQDNRYPENLQLVSDDRHKQITILETKIKHLEKQNLELLRQLDERNSYKRDSLQTC